MTNADLSRIDSNLDATVLGHPAGLFVLFFTEMWERFSYYGMRALLVLFLVSDIANGGWAWSREDAGLLYAWYTALVYLTPLVGGYLSDRYLGQRRAILIGGACIAAGHLGFIFDTQFNFFLGLTAIILGNGLFKPNMTTIVGSLYKDPDKKDAAYTIFYMGINCGSFLGMLLCGYVGEVHGWKYGFSLAGIFMLVGLLQFFFAKNIFEKAAEQKAAMKQEVKEEVRLDEVEEVAPAKGLTKVEKDRLIVVALLAFFSMIFFWAFEQAGSSMTIFARDYTQRALTGDSATLFFWGNLLLTLIPVIVITLTLATLVKVTFKRIALSNIWLILGFGFIWSLVIWKISNEFGSETLEVPASWFGILNPFFVITLAPVVSKIWSDVWNPIGPVKFALGLVSLGIGFGFLAYGAMGIQAGQTTASVSMFWMFAAYFFHTVGELCLSPVGLSYVNKLSPVRFMSTLFGVWLGFQFLGNLFAGYTASYIDTLNDLLGLSGFFLLFTAIPCGVGFIVFLLSKPIKKLMHGVH